MQDASSKQQTNKNTSSVIRRQDYHLTQPCPSEEKQTNENSAQTSPYKKITQTTGPNIEGRKRREVRIQPWSLGKGDLKHNKLKKKEKEKKRQRNTTQMKGQTRNTELQINKGEIGKFT